MADPRCMRVRQVRSHVPLVAKTGRRRARGGACGASRGETALDVNAAAAAGLAGCDQGRAPCGEPAPGRDEWGWTKVKEAPLPNRPWRTRTTPAARRSAPARC